MNSRYNSKKLTTSPCQNSSTILAAVALQDHLSRNLSLVDPLRQTHLNRRAPKAKPKKVNAVVDSRLRKPTKKTDKTEEEKEFVLDAKPHQLSLAQKLGIVESPEQPLSDDQWKKAKEKSNRRDDSKQPCVICKEDFGLVQQVLLSCSHVFHRNCLQAFERFTGKKTCPMCRKETYQTRVIYEGAREHRQKSAVLIQAYWRGYVVRSWYTELRKTVPPKDPKLRKKFYEKKLQSITDRILNSYDTRVDDFLSEIDRSVAASRDVFRHFEESSMRDITDDEWQVIQLKAVQRGHTECPICIMPLESTGLCTVSSQTTSHIRKTILLSCSHVYHLTCLNAFEELSLGEKKVCPVCRSGYQKLLI
ncbi:RING finger protein 32-like [Saccoglossus kowalevskii]|uniref:RING finger protein 32-like n=1 Tax=Saccoglossus kowalevskii TaxID=10224 RepID=A0ABM0M7W4_SACKO|nr:PREDICTED: RING finger protein 32-like [Saccoglossus kowalevskii]